MHKEISFAQSLPTVRIFVILILFLASLFIDLNELFLFLPLFLGLLYLVIIFYLLFEISKDIKFSLIGSIMNFATFFISRLFLDLICNIFAFLFGALSSYYLIKMRKSKSIFEKNLILYITLLFLMIFSHVWSIFIFFSIHVMYVLMVILLKHKNWRILLVKFAIVVCLLLSISIIINIWNYFPRIYTFGVSLRWQFIDRENPLIIVFAIIGLLIVSIKARKSDEILIVAWYLIPTVLVILNAYYYSYRIIAFIPTGILAGYGIYYVANFMAISFRKWNANTRRNIILKLLLIIITLPILTLSLSNAYIADHVARPPQFAMVQMEWIRTKYGFNSSYVLVAINKILKPASGIGESNYYNWAESEVGYTIYSGTILDISQGFPRQKFGSYDVEYWYHGYDYPPKDLDRRDILLPDEWYRMSPLEYAISEEIGSGIYNVTVRDLATIERVLRNVSRFFFENTSFFRVVAGWDNFYWDFENSSDCSFWLRPACANAWFGVEVDLTDYIGFQWGFTYVILKVSGNASGVFNVYIYVFDDYGVTASRNITAILTGRTVIIPVIVPANKAVWRVRLAFQSLVASPNYYHFTIKYLAIV